MKQRKKKQQNVRVTEREATATAKDKFSCNAKCAMNEMMKTGKYVVSVRK